MSFSPGAKKRKTVCANKLAIAALFAGFLLTMPECFVRAGNNAPDFATSWNKRQGLPLIWAAAQNIYYEPTIKKIIKADCGRCHAVASRYLMDYDSLKAFASSGMLGAMVQGSMSRFAGGDTRTILSWIESGASEKPPGKQAHFFSPDSAGSNRPGCPQRGTPLHVPADQITYSNSIKYILAGDCLRCHSGRFRNLTTYKNIKMYADNGLLKSLVQLGGPMHRFAGPDSRQIIAWVKNGAPK
jgi:hypothetical protein